LWVAVPYAAQHAMSRFSSFLFKTSSHQEWWFDGLTWPNRPELLKIRCAAVGVAKQMADWQAKKPYRV